MKPRKRYRTTAILATATLAILLAGCTSSQTSDGSKASTGGSEVAMKDVEFSPKDITVKAGTTVKWVNQDSMPHDVTAKDHSWESVGGPGKMAKGASFSRTFDAPGTYEYYCTLHSGGPGSGMWGKVIVT